MNFLIKTQDGDNVWKKHFSGEVLKEAQKYFNVGLVDDFKSSKSHASAVVADYNVFIDFNDSQKISMYCDCRSRQCIHQAATLYYLDNHCENDYSDLIKSLTHDELADFLSAELLQNPELANNLKLYKNMGADEEFLKNKLEKSYRSYVKVIDFISVDLEKLKIMGQIDLLLKLLKGTVEYLYELSDIGMYDEYDIVMDKIGNMINSLIDLNYIPQVSKFLADFILHSEDETVSDYFAYLYSRFADAEELFDE